MSGPGATASTSSVSSPWEVIITDWALDSYLNLKHTNVFSDQEYWTLLRPDVELLREGIPSPHTKFGNPKFWGPASYGGTVLPDGFKMKWHQIGSGKVQLRLPIMLGARKAFLCEAYVKSDPLTERRMLARFKAHMNQIALGHYVYRGSL